MPHLMMRPWPDDGADSPYEVPDGPPAVDRNSDAPVAGGTDRGAADPAPTRPATDAAVSRLVRCPECAALVVWTMDGSAFCCACPWYLDPTIHTAIIPDAGKART